MSKCLKCILLRRIRNCSIWALFKSGSGYWDMAALDANLDPLKRHHTTPYGCIENRKIWASSLIEKLNKNLNIWMIYFRKYDFSNIRVFTIVTHSTCIWLILFVYHLNFAFNFEKTKDYKSNKRKSCHSDSIYFFSWLLFSFELIKHIQFLKAPHINLFILLHHI